MVQAYILINTKPGKEEEILEKIKGLGIKLLDSALLYGEYDIIIKVEVDTIDKLRDIIINKLRKIEGVEKTVTLIVALL